MYGKIPVRPPFSATQLRAVYFDMGGVLIDVASDFNRYNALQYALAEASIQDFLPDDFSLESFTEYVDHRLETEYYAFDTDFQADAWIMMRDALTRFIRADVPYDLVHRAFWRYAGFMTERMSLKPEVMETLTTLRNWNFIVGLISNVLHPSIIYKELFTKWNILDYFNPLVFSSDTRYKKPDLRLFQYALSFHPGLQPEDCLYVGDTYHVDILGAHRAGMNPVWVNRHGDSNPLNVLEIRHVKELIPILKR